MTALRSSASHLSPAIGLGLGSALLRRLYDLEPAVQLAEGARVNNGVDSSTDIYRGSAVGALLRDSFHRNHPEEPLRPTTNRSLPAAHLSPSLTGHVLGLAWRRPGSAAVGKALREAVCSETGLDVPKLARTTGVTIARFERLVAQVCAADDELGAPLPHTGTAILLRHLWLRSSGRAELWTFLSTLDTHYGPVLAECQQPEGEHEWEHAREREWEHALEHEASRSAAAASARHGEVGEAKACEAAEAARRRAEAWIALPPFEAADLAAPAVLRAVRELFSADGTNEHGRVQVRPPRPAHCDPSAEGFERVAAAVALGGSRAAPLLQVRLTEID